MLLTGRLHVFYANAMPMPGDEAGPETSIIRKASRMHQTPVNPDRHLLAVAKKSVKAVSIGHPLISFRRLCH
jgi:hypothetical protein